MPKVFVINQPLRAVSREPTIDLRPAEAFGELIFLSPAGEPALDPSAWLGEMEYKLSRFNYDEDYLLPVGHPALIVSAAALLGRFAVLFQGARGIRLLRWDRRNGAYRVQSLPLFPNLEHGEPNVKISIS